MSQPKEDEKAFGGVNIVFHQFPHITPDQIVLPEETRQVIERNTVGFFKNIEPLRASGQSLKRGVLLFGKPGTGKTFTAKWLAQAIPDLTVILLSGDQLWHITHACQLARMLAPSLVIMEDVDLIAAERDERKHPMYQVTLHQLMNEMDGLSSEVPVLFLLTTNRPDAIESAIASRPGRVDQAIEYPLPDPGCRRKLIDLYGSGMVLRLDRQDEWMARTDGASPAFIKEWLRKAAMIAIEKGSMEGGRALVTDDHAESAIRELIFFGGSVTRELLGFSAEQQDA